MPETSQVLTTQQKIDKANAYLYQLLKGVCLNDFRIEQKIDERGLVLDVLPNDKDTGYVIGTKGIIIFSIRNLMKMFSTRFRAEVKVLVEGKGEEFYFRQ